MKKRSHGDTHIYYFGNISKDDAIKWFKEITAQFAKDGCPATKICISPVTNDWDKNNYYFSHYRSIIRCEKKYLDYIINGKANMIDGGNWLQFKGLGFSCTHDGAHNYSFDMYATGNVTFIEDSFGKAIQLRFNDEDIKKFDLLKYNSICTKYIQTKWMHVCHLERLGSYGLEKINGKIVSQNKTKLIVRKLQKKLMSKK